MIREIIKYVIRIEYTDRSIFGCGCSLSISSGMYRTPFDSAHFLASWRSIIMKEDFAVLRDSSRHSVQPLLEPFHPRSIERSVSRQYECPNTSRTSFPSFNAASLCVSISFTSYKIILNTFLNISRLSLRTHLCE